MYKYFLLTGKNYDKRTADDVKTLNSQACA